RTRWKRRVQGARSSQTLLPSTAHRHKREHQYKIMGKIHLLCLVRKYLSVASYCQLSQGEMRKKSFTKRIERGFDGRKRTRQCPVLRPRDTSCIFSRCRRGRGRCGRPCRRFAERSGLQPVVLR